MSFGLDEVNYALKYIYPKRPPMNIASWPHPFFSRCEKDDSWTGEEQFPQGVEYGNPQGIGGDFVKAQAASLNSSTKGKKFLVDRIWKNGFARIQGRSIVATGNNEGAFFRAVQKETDGGIRAYGDRLSVEAINGNGEGWIGIVAAGGITGSVVTLTSRFHATRFKEGMTLNSSTDGTLGNITAHSSVITKVNYKAGTITLSNVTNLTAGDYLAAAGDFEEGGVTGVVGWIPLTEPGTSDSFFGVNRSANPTLLGGHRLDAGTAGNSIKEQAMDLSAEMGTIGTVDDDGEYDGYLHPLNWNRLSKELDAQTKRDQGAGGKFGHPYIEQAAGGKTIKWFQDQDWPANLGHILTRKTWVIRHAQGFPHLNNDDGRPAQRAYNDDAIEVRLRSSGNLFCLAPGANGVFPITPPA